jgi:hypothetical protein
MDWDSFRMVGALGALTLVILVGWDRWATSNWRGLRAPSPLWRLLIEWVVYMGLFLLLSLIMQGALRLACSICG